MKTPASIILLLFLCVVLVAHAGAPGDDIKGRQAELGKLRQEIQQLENKIKDREKRETSTLELIDAYDKQVTLVRKAVRNLHDQEQSLQQDIDKTRNEIRELGGQLTFLKKHYASYVAGMYKSGRTYDLELLLSARSVNQALIRSEYLRRFSEQRKHDMDKIVDKRDDVEESNLRLQKQLADQRQLLLEKASEEQTLSEKMKKRQIMLADIRRDKRSLRKEMSRTTAAAQELEQLIGKLVEQDRIRKQREAEKAAREAAKARQEGKAPPPPPPSSVTVGKPFHDKRGKMRWPVEQGKIVARFGNQQHPVLHTITQNTGIDITLPVGSNVAATSDGEVSTISWLPSFGNLIIVDHSGGYRTVYAHLSEITVQEGEHVNEGALIGKSGEALTGPLLHFEVWKDRDKQDPETWLLPHGLARR